MALNDLIDTEKEILVVRHKALNDSKINFAEECDKIQNQLFKYTNGRKIIPTFEGDYGLTFGGVGEMNDLVFAHPPLKDYFAWRGLISKGEFEDARANGKARYLLETLEDLEKCKSKGYDIALFLESKFKGTDVSVNTVVMSLLKQGGFERTYFGSSYPSNLAEVRKANEIVGTNYAATQILRARISLFGKVIGQNGSEASDFVTVGRPTDFFREYSKPTVVSAIGNKSVIEELSANKNIIGVGWKEEYEHLGGVTWDYTLGHFF